MPITSEPLFIRKPNIIERKEIFRTPLTPAQIKEASAKRQKLRATIQSLNEQKADPGDIETLLASKKIAPIPPQNDLKLLMLKDQQARLNEPDPDEVDPKKAARIRDQITRVKLAQLSVVIPKP